MRLRVATGLNLVFSQLLPSTASLACGAGPFNNTGDSKATGILADVITSLGSAWQDPHSSEDGVDLTGGGKTKLRRQSQMVLGPSLLPSFMH